mgnify:CR=1 FL=1
MNRNDTFPYDEGKVKKRANLIIKLFILILILIPINVFADVDYSELMAECVVNQDEKMGEVYMVKSNKKVNLYGGYKFTYEDLEVLSKIIEAESGMEWLDEYIRMCVGEVLLNRVASKDFPDTIREVAYQEGQYHHIKYGLFDEIVPTMKSVRTALRLLNGERVINDKDVVFQANFPQGSGIYEIIHDNLLGNTYLCYSNNRE